MANAPNVWTQMNYVPPRGQCNHKQSVLSPRCPCLRFMLHPLKSSSSYECDGCGHHASFHSMENKIEDEIRKRWEQEAKDKADREGESQQRPKKRVRAIEYRLPVGAFLEEEPVDASAIATSSSRSNTRTRGAPSRRINRAAGLRAKGRITETMEEEEDEVVELD